MIGASLPSDVRIDLERTGSVGAVTPWASPDGVLARRVFARSEERHQWRQDFILYLLDYVEDGWTLSRIGEKWMLHGQHGGVMEVPPYAFDRVDRAYRDALRVRHEKGSTDD